MKKALLGIIIALAMVGIFLAATRPESAPPSNSNVSSSERLFIDVRTPGEFAAGHVEGAINIPYDATARFEKELEPDPSRVIVVYCRSGGRSEAAKETLLAQGHPHVVNAGGMAGARAMLSE